MPRLFDLLSEDAKKELVKATRKHSKSTGKPHRHKDPAVTGHGVEKAHPAKEITPAEFVAFDVETTGLDFKNDRIIEIGAVKFKHGEITEEFTSFINPGIPIPSVITDLTGIVESDLAAAPSFAQIADRLLSFIGALPLCGHQIEFDTTFLKEEFKRLGKSALDNDVLDTALLSRILLDPHGRFSLKYVCNALDIKLDNAHRALHDARASGEAALRLIPKIAQLPLTVRQTIAACSPASLFKTMVIKTLSGSRPEIVFTVEGEKTPARISSPDEFESIDPEMVGSLFSKGGELSSIINSYTPRASQSKMALSVTDALNTQGLLIAEAGTGTGKSLAYLIPAARWAVLNNTRVIVSTYTRNLQDQLVSRDLPIASRLAGGTLNYSVLKGRNNYLCLFRFSELLRGRTGNLSPRERFAVLPLVVWASSSQTGDIEEQNQFNPKWFSKVWKFISAEHHECGRRKCPFYQSCFFHKARNRALGSHVVVINHALFFSDLCSGTSFLGPVGTIIFDEAHHLESSGHRFLRVELDTNRINLFAETINNLTQHTGARQEEKQVYECGRELRSLLKQFRKCGAAFLNRLVSWAKETAQATAEYQIAYSEATFSVLPESTAFYQMVVELTEKLSALRETIKSLSEGDEFEQLAIEAQACSEQASQLKADFLYLTSALTEDHVFWAEGNVLKGWAKLCGVPLDVGSLLSDMWEQCSGAAVFTSATLSIAGSFEYFKRTSGLARHEARTVSEIYKSPFGAHQSIAGAIRSAPDVDTPRYGAYVAQAILDLHVAFSKNILVLFTANSLLSAVYQILRANPLVEKGNLLAQGVSGSRQIILDEFRKSSRMILLGTDSFWEGIDVPGEACEMVIIPRLPFPVPTHPLTQAIARRVEEKEGDSFFSYSIPEAVIRFRQGCGRLIRTSTDRGALLVLDNRIVNRGYGKQFVRSINSDFRVFEDFADAVGSIKAFFDSDVCAAGESDITYVPMEEV